MMIMEGLVGWFAVTRLRVMVEAVRCGTWCCSRMDIARFCALLFHVTDEGLDEEGMD